ncbi:MAG: translation initiation factor IF-1 [Patescibacteria group bacterium]
MDNKKEIKESTEGTIIEALPGMTFRVQLKDGSEILAYLAGKMRVHYIKVIPGDEVLVEMSSYDKTRGRITRRR